MVARSTDVSYSAARICTLTSRDFKSAFQGLAIAKVAEIAPLSAKQTRSHVYLLLCSHTDTQHRRPERHYAKSRAFSPLRLTLLLIRSNRAALA